MILRRPILPILALLCAVPTSRAWAETDARMQHVRGAVMITPQGGAARKPVWGEMPLEEGDLIKTGDGTADIFFEGGRTLLHLKENSALKFKRFAAKECVFEFTEGVLLAKVKFEKDSGQRFSVETPSAEVTVSGTEFVIEQSGPLMRVGVLNEGHVTVSVPGYKKEVVLHFNQETQVQGGMPPERTRTLDRLYPHKIAMGQMRQRIKSVRKRWDALTPEHRQHVRSAWIKNGAAPAKKRRSRQK